MEAKWKTSLRETWGNVPLEELLDEVLNLAQGDGYDGMHTNHGYDEYLFMVKMLKERIAALKE